MAAEPLSEVNEERLAEMLLRWEEQNEKGKDVSVEELCRECPELLSILRDRIQALRNLAWLGNHQPCETNQDQGITPPAERKSGDATISGYKLVKPLGRGGFGEVWLAESPDGTQKAMKFVNRGRGWIHEWRGIARMKNVQHPLVLAVEQHKEVGQELVIVSELAECSLQDYFHRLRQEAQSAQPLPFARDSENTTEETKTDALGRRYKKHRISPGSDKTIWLPYSGSVGDCALTPGSDSVNCILASPTSSTKFHFLFTEAIRLLRDAAEALDYMADVHNLLHLDVKPTNLLCVDGRCKVGDFGAVVRSYKGLMAEAGKGETLAFFGPRTPLAESPQNLGGVNEICTAKYAPPEALVDGIFNHTFDQYSLALTFCELVAGQIPFSGGIESQIQQRVHGEIDLSFLPSQYRKSVMRAISPHSDNRFGSCREFIRVLSGIARSIRIRGINGNVEGKVWESTSVLRSGRLTTLEMVIDDNSVSRRHAEIRWSGTAWIVRDLGSTNGTFLNGVRLGPGEWPIRPRDIVRFGNVTVVVDSAAARHDWSVNHVPERKTESPQPGRCKPVWKIVIPGNRPLATPAIANNKVFVGGGFGSQEFFAFAADTGKPLWSYRTQDDGPTAAITLDELVAFNTESCELEVLTVEGKPVWKKWLGDPLLTQPAAGDGRVFIVYPDSHGDRQHYLGCFDLYTGDLIWRQSCGCDAITAPVLAEGNVYLTTQGGTIHCFHQDDGTCVWTKARSATSSPVVRNKACYYSRREAGADLVQHECLSRSHPDRGCQDFADSWCRADYLDYSRRRSHSEWESLSQTFDAGVGFSTWKGHSSMGMSQANLGHGTVAGVWSYQGSKPFIYRNRLYGCMGRHLECLDPLSGEIIWKTQIVDGEETLVDHALTPPVTVNGKIIVATLFGELACLCAETGAWLWREIIGEPIAFQPAVANGRVFVATTRGGLHCLETGDSNDDGWFMWGGTPAHNGIDDSPNVMDGQGV